MVSLFMFLYDCSSIAINLLVNSAAPFVYHHCSCMDTCDNVKGKLANQNSTCTALGEGCFCPKGKALLKDKCVVERECTPCDENNHYPGDTWYLTKCDKCVCNNDTTITCSKKECPVSQTICSLGFVSVVTSLPDECCKKYTCVPETPKLKAIQCPKVTLPKCAENQVNKMLNGTDGCPKYICGNLTLSICSLSSH